MDSEKKEKRSAHGKNRYRDWISTKLKRSEEEAAEEMGEAEGAAAGEAPPPPPPEAAPSPEEAAELSPPTGLPLEQDFLQILWRSWAGGRAAGKPYSPLGLTSLQPMEGFGDDRAEVEAFLKEQQLFAESLVLRLGDPEAPPAGAQVHVLVSRNQLRAWVFLYPPGIGGEDATDALLQEALQSEQVVFGLDEEGLHRAVEERRYLQLIDAAMGKPPVPGEDGELVECLSRQSSVERREGEDELEEFENRITFQNVSVGTVLYRATQPTEGTDGIDVRGNRRKGRMGKAPQFPRIPNTALSEDHTELVSTVDGVVSFMNGQFVLEKLLVVAGSVDTSTGDIDFDGDVQIDGDVCEGRTVTATGSITVHGMVEIGHLKAGRDILLIKGMNGNQEGTLHAGRDITSKYLENCTVQAGGLIQTNSIVCCDVVSDDEIRVDGSKGFIIGGSCTALRKITAAGIGAKSQRATLIVLGTTPHLLQRCMELESELETAQKELEQVEKDLRYLQNLPPVQMTEERRKLQSQYRLKKPLLSLRIKKLEAQHDELEEQIQDVGACRLLCNTLYPATKILIGNAAMNVETEHRLCTVYYSRDRGSIVVTSA